ncbi:hypothetical protein [Shewanella baltica]|uniref:hypothetical protein n=1 Tax=Shewanella baltica TaxID=62322 RepID=UPI003D79EEDF
MGSSSRSASTQATENNSTTFGIQGANNGLILNGSGNTVTDGGAFKLVGDVVDTLPIFFSQGAGMVSDGFNAVSDIGMIAERQNEHLLNTAGNLFGDVSNSQNEMMRLGASVLTETGDILQNSQANAFDFGSDAMRHVGKTADSAIYANSLVTTDAMRSNADLTALVAGALQNANNSNADLAGLSMNNSASLAESLSRTALDSNNEANDSAMSELQRGFDSMMGFAEQYSRSDGAALAENNNKTMMYTLGGAALVAGVIVLAGRK